MSKKLFEIEDYLAFCEHQEPLVREWALKRLVTLYPHQEVTREKVFEFIEKYSDVMNIGFIINDYFSKYYLEVPGEALMETLGRTDDFLMKSILLEVLAKKGYKLDEVYRQTVYIFGEFNETLKENDFIAYTRLQDVLVEINTLEALQTLKSVANTRTNDSLSIYYKRILEFKRPKTTAKIIDELFRDLGKLSDKFLDSILVDYSELFDGKEFARFLIHNLAYEEEIEEVLGYLEKYWPLNSGVRKFLELLNDYPVASLYSEEEYKDFIDLLINLLINELKQRYPHLVFLKESSIDTEVLLSEQSSIRKQDFWIALFVSSQKSLKKRNIRPEKIKSIVNLLLSMLIVILEDNDYEQMIEEAKDDREYLWEVFTLDRRHIPDEISGLVIEQGNYYEDRLIQIIQYSRYDNFLERTLEVLDKIKSSKAIPHLLKLTDREQVDFINEKVIEVLQNNISLLPLELLEESIINGDSTARIFLGSLLEYYPYDRTAEFLIECWQKGIIDIFEEFVHTLLYIGSKKGLEYLDDMAASDDPVYLYEAILVLAAINGADEDELTAYRFNLKMAKKEAENRKHDILGRLLSQDKKKPSLDDNLSKIDEYAENEEGTIIRVKEKVGRNAPCPCGSGKKYKKCCGR
jgi:hypothetical protein